MSPWDDEDPEGLERPAARFRLREEDSGSEAEAAGGVRTREEEEAGWWEVMLLGGEAPWWGRGSEGNVRRGGERDEGRRGAVCGCSSVGLLGAEDGASAALRDMFIETARERLQLSSSGRECCVN